jgi:hypothetical protein
LSNEGIFAPYNYNNIPHVVADISLRDLTKYMNHEVVYRNMQDLVGHTSGEAKFNRHEILYVKI